MRDTLRMRDLVGTATGQCLYCRTEGATLREVPNLLGVGGRRRQFAYLCEECGS